MKALCDHQDQVGVTRISLNLLKKLRKSHRLKSGKQKNVIRENIAEHGQTRQAQGGRRGLS